jgi:hypothetical protein
MGDILFLWYCQLYPWSSIRLYVSDLRRWDPANSQGVVRLLASRPRREVSLWPPSTLLLVSVININDPRANEAVSFNAWLPREYRP